MSCEIQHALYFITSLFNQPVKVDQVTQPLVNILACHSCITMSVLLVVQVMGTVSHGQTILPLDH